MTMFISLQRYILLKHSSNFHEAPGALKLELLHGQR